MANTNNDALSLDIRVLTLLLQRNHHQQHRCIYYRRLSMVLLALKRASSSASLDWVLIEQFDRLSRQLYQQCQQRRSDTDDARKSKRMRKEEQWTIQRDNEHDTIKIINENDPQTSSHSDNNNNNNTSTTQQLINIIQTIRTLTTKTLPEISSRIINATSPLLHEISRGFFVPFCTVAISCLGRIHVLVMKFGRELVGILSEHVPKLRECLSSSAAAGGGNNAAARGDADLIALTDTITPVFSVVQQTNKKEDSNNNNNDSSYCDEWNALMKQFLEVSHDDLTKSINRFVKERRWKDAMLAFGIKDFGVANDNSDVSQDIEKATNDVGIINESVETDDMGELVYNTQPSGHDEKVSKGSSVDVDDNLARVLQKKKRRNDDVNEAVSASAKKRRKRKRKKKSAPNDDDIETTSHNNDDLKKEIVNTEREEEIDDKNTLKSVEAPFEDPTELDSDRDEVELDIKESEAKKQKKDKKKKKKSKKTKKRSSNVIDDIFG